MRVSPPRSRPLPHAGVTGWNPWQALRSRSHIVFRFDPIAQLAGGAVYARRGERAAIVMDPRLDTVERRAWLAHELVHDERGGGCAWPDMPTQWAAVVAREEAAVERIVARRLIPRTELAAFVATQVDIEGHVTAAAVADRFEVPLALAELALRDWA